MRHLMLLAALCCATPAFGKCEPGQTEHPLTGFRSARFGMTQDEVRAAVKRDFGPDAALAAIDPGDPGKTALQFSLLQLNPGPGPATIVYLFNAATGRLVHVNVGWVTGSDPGELHRLAIATAGQRLQTYFNALTPKLCEADTGGVIGPAKVLLYRGRDSTGRWVEVTVDGIRFETPAASADPTEPLQGPAALRVSYGEGEPSK